MPEIRKNMITNPLEPRNYPYSRIRYTPARLIQLAIRWLYMMFSPYKVISWDIHLPCHAKHVTPSRRGEALSRG